jgi:hypothetical protein
MYWDQPLIACRWPQDPDPFPQLLGQDYLLFWHPEFDFRALKTNQRLDDLCAWACHGLNGGLDRFVADERNHYDIANLVKLNMWAADIRRQGIIKPWLILDWGNGVQEAGTGDSRMRLCEIMPEIQSVTAYVSTHRSRAHLYADLEPIHTLHEFAQRCGATIGQQFLFRPSKAPAPFGIYWYEYDSELTRAVTPDQSWCVSVFEHWYRTHPTTITAHWFLEPIPWQAYAGTVR